MACFREKRKGEIPPFISVMTVILSAYHLSAIYAAGCMHSRLHIFMFRTCCLTAALFFFGCSCSFMLSFNLFLKSCFFCKISGTITGTYTPVIRMRAFFPTERAMIICHIFYPAPIIRPDWGFVLTIIILRNFWTGIRITTCFREKRKGENPPFFDTTPKEYELFNYSAFFR